MVEPDDGNLRHPQQEALQESLQDAPTEDIRRLCAILYAHERGEAFEKEVFRNDCQRLYETFVNLTAIQARQDNVLVVFSEDELKVYFVRFWLQWEREVIKRATATIMPLVTSFPLPSDDELQHMFWEIYAYFKRLRACGSIFNRYGDLYSKDYVEKIIGIVQKRWLKWWQRELSDEDAAAQITSSTKLWDYESEIPVPWIRELRVREFYDFLKNNVRPDKKTRRDADNFFWEFMCCSGIPEAAVPVVSAYKSDIIKMPSFQASYFNELHCENDDQKLTHIIKSIKRISDRTFWFHYAGHHEYDGLVRKNVIPTLPQMLHCVGALLSNIVITMDCCYADVCLEGFNFSVDSEPEFSGCTVIAACCGSHKLALHNRFVDLLIRALNGGCLNCDIPVMRCALDDELYKRVQCAVCSNFRDISNRLGTIDIDAIYHFVREHLDVMNVRPTLRLHRKKGQLPVAFSSTSRSYKLTLLKNVEYGRACDDCQCIPFPQVPSLKTARIFILQRMLVVTTEGQGTHSCFVTLGTRRICCFVISRSFNRKNECPENCDCIGVLYDHLVGYCLLNKASQETASGATYSEEFKQLFTTSLTIVLHTFKLLMKTNEGEWTNVETNEQLKAALESSQLFCKVVQN